MGKPTKEKPGGEYKKGKGDGACRLQDYSSTESDKDRRRIPRFRSPPRRMIAIPAKRSDGAELHQANGGNRESTVTSAARNKKEPCQPRQRRSTSELDSSSGIVEPEYDDADNATPETNFTGGADWRKIWPLPTGDRARGHRFEPRAGNLIWGIHVGRESSAGLNWGGVDGSVW